MKTTIIAIAAVLAASWTATAGEIQPTHELVSKALRQQQRQQPKETFNPEEYEYHFRKAGDVILFCVYYIGANGGYCTKNGTKYVTRTDQAAAQWCRESPNSDPPHAVYGEAGDLDYRCKGSRMTRLPYSYFFDEEGYVRRQWQVLS
jgi:hypothetical protein